MTIKQFSDANETEYAIFMSEGGYLPLPHTLDLEEAAKIAMISDQLVGIEYSFTVGGTQFKSTKYMMTEYLFRNYESWAGLPLGDAGTFLQLMETVADMISTHKPQDEQVVGDVTDVLPPSFDSDPDDEEVP